LTFVIFYIGQPVDDIEHRRFDQMIIRSNETSPQTKAVRISHEFKRPGSV
jgi:hypothetical protein